uniref:Uncharacterized protein n=1 Tax=Anguilla anguilla TaxID=7936 RepID=A0A0E9V6L1_ANGAN
MKSGAHRHTPVFRNIYTHYKHMLIPPSSSPLLSLWA